MDDTDRLVFLEILGNLVNKYNWLSMLFVCWITIATSWWKHRTQIFPWECDI